ncbi:hypothetical protein [Candidatus Odyssella thessalonicensis]|uniref:hypothetical protein n=1 Tax=Candidatus Odyssella thessalonicensis TaxID=84647 RepID=UPI000225B935|nr:hypothetical protein [Candidatus Odyssella thessalonicensis]
MDKSITMTNRAILYGLLLGGIPLIEAGCNPFMVFRPDSEALVKKGWAKQPHDQKEPEPLYCYHSLGHNVCHSAPLDSQSRLENYYGPRPY